MQRIQYCALGLKKAGIRENLVRSLVEACRFSAKGDDVKIFNGGVEQSLFPFPLLSDTRKKVFRSRFIMI